MLILEEITEPEPSSTLGIWLPVALILAVFLLLLAVLMIAKRKNLGAPNGKIILQMPKVTVLIMAVFSFVWVIGTVLAWFLLPKEMEGRLATQIILTIFSAFFIIVLPLSARQRLLVEGNEILYRPMIGKEKTYRFNELSYVTIRPAGFEGSSYKYYDSEGKKLFSFSSATPYTENFFQLVQAKNKHIRVIDRRQIGPNPNQR